MRFVVTGLAILLLLIGSIYFLKRSSSPVSQMSVESRAKMSETIHLKTKDGLDIAGDYYPAPGRSGVLLLHMLPADRKSWVAFAQKLRAAGFKVLAIDLRGHGESQGGPDGYKKFSDEEHQASRLDVEAGAEFLKDKGSTEIHLIGASIGANLALNYLAAHEESRSAILLSPGLDYRGVKTLPAISRLGVGQGVYLVVSEEDAYSLDSVNKLAQKIILDGRHVLKVFSNSGHGTAILEKNPEFGEELINWLKKF